MTTAGASALVYWQVNERQLYLVKFCQERIWRQWPQRVYDTIGMKEAAVGQSYCFSIRIASSLRFDIEKLPNKVNKGTKPGADTCKTPYSRQYCETKYNIDLMEGKKVSPGACFPGEDSTPAGAFKLRAANWSPRSLVTPEISGLVCAADDCSGASHMRTATVWPGASRPRP
jgi:hypothetical protein